MSLTISKFTGLLQWSVIFQFLYDLDIDKSYKVSNTFPSRDDVQDKLPFQL